MENTTSDPEELRLKNAFGEALGDLPTAAETEEAWNRFSRRIGQKERRRAVRMWTSVAAAAAVVLLVCLLPWKRMVGLQDERELFAAVDSPSRVTSAVAGDRMVFLTPSATTASVTLSDGTKVLLNANSRLEYPKTFPASGTRDVRLSGEARFEVAKDRRRPFIVTAGGMRTQVLGTVFDVDAYSVSRTAVTLFQGKVRVSDTKQQVKKDIVPGQKAVLTSNGLTVGQADLAAAGSWTAGDFSFDEMPLGDAVTTIGTWYNAGVVFRSSALESVRVHFLFPRSASLQTVIGALNDLGIAKFTLRNGRIEVAPL